MTLARNSKNKEIAKPRHNLFSIIFSLILWVELHLRFVWTVNFIICWQISQGSSFHLDPFPVTWFLEVFYSHFLMHCLWTYLWVPVQAHGDMSSSLLTPYSSKHILQNFNSSSNSGFRSCLLFIISSLDSIGTSVSKWS